MDGGGLAPLGGALACCPKLKKLDLYEMGADDAAMAAFGGALGDLELPFILSTTC